jgi:HAL2 family 3'(2'),5'-bisphosphate nucleotidase
MITLTAFDSELHTGLAAVRQAAVACRSVQSSITPDSLAKKDKSPVTVADFASQAIVCRRLQMEFPDDPVIGEEGAEELRLEEGAAFLNRVVFECASAGVAATSDKVCEWIDRGGLQEYRPRFWTLDPIDGTKGFLRNEQYAISLALIVDGVIELGILGCPNMAFAASDVDKPVGTLAWAIRGQGAWAVPMNNVSSPPQRLHVSGETDFAQARFCESVEAGHSSHDWSSLIAKQLGISADPVRIDSQCKYLALARGDAEIYLRLPTRRGYQEKIWDHAGGIRVVLEAGGCVTDIHGAAPDFSKGPTLAENEGMVVTGGPSHAAVVEAVGARAPTRSLEV